MEKILDALSQSVDHPKKAEVISKLKSEFISGKPRSGQLTQFLRFPFLYKIIDLPGLQINDPLSGKHFSLPFLPVTPLSPSRTLEGLF